MKSKKLGLELTEDSAAQKTFGDWRKEINGTQSSNMTIIDEAVGQLQKDVQTLNDGGLVLKDTVIDSSVKSWLTAHPEATTTVQDGSITADKLAPTVKQSVEDVPGLKQDLTEVSESIVEILGDNISLQIPMKTGGYYSRSGSGALSFIANSDTYCDPYDLSEYIGKEVHVHFTMSATTTSTRITALTNSNSVSSSVIAEYKYEKDYFDGSDFVCYPTEENHWLYISYSNRVTGMDVTCLGFGRLQEAEKEIEIVKKEVEAMSGGMSYIQPHDFPSLPYKIIKTDIGYALDKGIEAYKNIESFEQIYVDSANGSDSNDGKTESKAYKTFKKALQTYASGTVPCCIVILDDAVFFEDALNGETKVLKSLAVIAKSRAKLISGYGNVSWTSVGSGTYSAAVSAQVLGCVELSNVAKDGLYNPMAKATSIDNCKAIENSYFIDGNTTVYVHPVSDVSTVIPLTNDYKVRWNHQSANTPSHFLYLKNIDVVGSYYDACRTSAYPSNGSTFELIMENCTFQHNMRGDMIPANDYDVIYQIGCTGGYSKADVFNSHHAYSTQDMKDNCVVVTMNCRAREGGFYATSHGNNNLFTSHDGENVLRLNCNGINSDGPLFADVNGCRSVYADCESWNTGYAGVAQAGSWQFNNVNAVRQGFVSLENCNVYDSRNNPRIMSECDIEVKNTDVFTNCNITGNITTFNEL